MSWPRVDRREVFTFLAGAPYQYLHNFAFQMKVLFMLAAGVNVLLFYATGTWPRTQSVGAGEPVPWAAKIAGGVSLFLWIGVMYWGRMLTFFRPPFVVPPKWSSVLLGALGDELLGRDVGDLPRELDLVG